MTDYVIDSCSGTAWQPFTAHSADKGGPITKHPDEAGDFYVVNGRALCRRAPAMVYYGAIPASADYTVEADIVVMSSVGSSGVAGRISTTARTYYTAYIEQGTNKVVLAKRVAGAITSMGTSASSYGIGTHTLSLEMTGTTINALIDGVVVVTDTDSSITAVGRGGIRAPVVSDTYIGKHIDNIIIYDAGAPASTARSYAVIVGL